MKGRFYQLVPIARPRDAIGRMALGLQRLTRKMGYDSLVFTERQQSLHLGRHYFGGLRKGLLTETPFWAGEKAPDFSLYHHSIGTVVADRFLEWPAQKKILVYHNITPPELMAQSSPQAMEHAEWGLEQLTRLVQKTDLEIGLSRFSCDELKKLGARHVVQLPYFLWKRDLPAVFRGTSRADAPLVLIVGRVEPHKRVLESIEAFASLKHRFPTARLVVAGNTKGNSAYTDEIRSRIARKDLRGSVRLTGRISDRSLNRLYSKARALLTLSEHEGFCVPLVEAMRARLPVVAFPSGAIPETLGHGGILVPSRDPQTVAKALESCFTDDKIRVAQAEEAARFSTERFETEFVKALEGIS